jgi:hypothetical protein
MPSRKFWPTTLSLSEDVMLALRHAAWRGVAWRAEADALCIVIAN